MTQHASKWVPPASQVFHASCVTSRVVSIADPHGTVGALAGVKGAVRNVCTTVVVSRSDWRVFAVAGPSILLEGSHTCLAALAEGGLDGAGQLRPLRRRLHTTPSSYGGANHGHLQVMKELRLGMLAAQRLD